MTRVFLFIISAALLPLFVAAQEKDTLIVQDSAGIIRSGKCQTVEPSSKDDAAKKKFSPRQAAIRSAILPGLGQIYNKKYWKVPIVYAAVGIPAYLFFDNKAWYNRTRHALRVMQDPAPVPDSILATVHPSLRRFVTNKDEGSLLYYRSEFRRDMDYSILITLLMWGLNIVDATVDAHLKGFDVSDDLSLRIRPALLPGNAAGISLAFTFGRNRPKTISSLPQF